MKTNKNYYPIIAASCLTFGMLIPVSSGGEKESFEKPKAAKVAAKDKVVEALTSSVIDPLTQQAKRSARFSRRAPTHSTSYHLVESSMKSTEGLRLFSVMVKHMPMRKSAKETTSEFLKLRYIAKGDQILVNLKDRWVKLDEHPITAKLVKTKSVANLLP